MSTRDLVFEGYLKQNGCRGVRFISVPDEPGTEGVVYLTDSIYREKVGAQLLQHPSVVWVAPPATVASVLPFRTQPEGVS